MREIIEPEYEGDSWEVWEGGNIAGFDAEQDAKDFAALPELVEAAKACYQAALLSVTHLKEYQSCVASDPGFGENFKARTITHIEHQIKTNQAAIVLYETILAKMGRNP